MPLQIRRGTEAERLLMTQPLAEGELLYVTTDQRIFVGDGITLGGIGITGYNDKAAQDATASLFDSGTHENISFVYNDGAGSISAIVDLSDYDGIIDAEGIRAPILGISDFVFFNNATNEVNLNGIVASNIIPTNPDIFDIGAESLKFKDLYLSNSVRIGSAHITDNGIGVNLPAGSTVGGAPLGTGGIVEGSNYRINILAEDSSIIVDSVNGTFRGNVVSPINSDIIINATDKLATLQGITLESPAIINGNPVFLSNLTSIVSSTPSLTEPTLAVAVASATNIGGSISLTRARGNALAPEIVEDGDEIGALEYGAFVGNGFVSVGNLTATVDGVVTFGQPAPIKLDLKISNGTSIIDVATIKSTQIEFTAVPIVPNVTEIERDALTPQFGMMIYNTTTNKFQGYQNTGGVTPEWADLS